MSEIENVRKAALYKAGKEPFIQVEVEPQTVIVKETIHITVRFFGRSSDNLSRLDPIDVIRPVVEMIGEPGPGEKRITYLQKKEMGLYKCDLVPTVPGTHAYKVKEKEETNIGELVEVEVLNEHA